MDKEDKICAYSINLLRVGDYLGKAYAEDMNDKYKVRDLLNQWLKENPDMGIAGENGFLNFMYHFMSKFFREIFHDTNTVIKTEITSDFTKDTKIEITQEYRKV